MYFNRLYARTIFKKYFFIKFQLPFFSVGSVKTNLVKNEG